MKKLQDFLLNNYEVRVKKTVRNKFREWIRKCIGHNLDSRRLLYCIGIDTKFKLVKTRKYVNLFNQIDYYNSFEPHHLFHNATIKANGTYHFFSEKNSKKTKDQYCSMVKLWTFARYSLEKNYKKDELSYLKECLLKGDYKNIKLSGISSQKPREVSWVTLLSEIKKLRKTVVKNKLNIVDYFCNKLGLYWDHMGTSLDSRPEWILLTYPKNIDENFYQPIAVNADWKSEDGLYLSYKNFDEFGRTRTQTRIRSFTGVKERVHHKIDKSYEYSAEYLGQSMTSLRETSSIINQAKFRFNEK